MPDSVRYIITERMQKNPPLNTWIKDGHWASNWNSWIPTPGRKKKPDKGLDLKMGRQLKKQTDVTHVWRAGSILFAALIHCEIQGRLGTGQVARGTQAWRDNTTVCGENNTACRERTATKCKSMNKQCQSQCIGHHKYTRVTLGKIVLRQSCMETVRNKKNVIAQRRQASHWDGYPNYTLTSTN